MLYTETITRRELERIMRQIPNFRPRGHGVMILCKHEYSAKDCDCGSCPHHTGRGRKIGCGLEKCLCLEERIKAGAASYKETLRLGVRVERRIGKGHDPRKLVV